MKPMVQHNKAMLYRLSRMKLMEQHMQQRNVVVTQQNEAYGTAQQRNVVVTQPNEAYGTLEEDYVTVV